MDASLLERIDDDDHELARELDKLRVLLQQHVPDVDLGGGNTLASRMDMLLAFTVGRLMRDERFLNS